MVVVCWHFAQQRPQPFLFSLSRVLLRVHAIIMNNRNKKSLQPTHIMCTKVAKWDDETTGDRMRWGWEWAVGVNGWDIDNEW